jgi:hypothetical protein
MAAWEEGVLEDIGDTLGNGSKKNPEHSPTTHGQQANAEEMFFQGDFMGAAEAFTDAISLLPVSDKRGRAELLVKRATAFLRAGKYALANWDVELVLQDKTENESRTARALFIRSMIRRQKADFEGCEADLRAALSVPIWGEDSRKKLEAMLNTLKPEIQKFRFVVWLLKAMSAIMSWMVWYLFPLFMFTTSWLVLCVHTFTVLFPSGEPAEDAWRVQVSATLGVIVAAGAWSWWLTEYHLRSKESDSNRMSIRDRISGFCISVRVFGLIPAIRMLLSVVCGSSHDGRQRADMDQLKQDIGDIQRRVDPSKPSSTPEQGSTSGKDVKACTTNTPADDKKKERSTAPDKKTDSALSQSTSGSTSSSSSSPKQEQHQAVNSTLSTASSSHTAAQTKGETDKHSHISPSKNTTSSPGGTSKQNPHKTGQHQQATGHASQHANDAAGLQNDAAHAQRQQKESTSAKCMAERADSVTASLKSMNDDLEMVKKAMELERKNNQAAGAQKHASASESSITDEDIAASADRQYESNLVKESGNDAYKKASQLNGAARQRKLKEAYDLYTQAHEIDRENVVVLSNRAAVLMALNKPDQAVADCLVVSVCMCAYSHVLHGRLLMCEFRPLNHRC